MDTIQLKLEPGRTYHLFNRGNNRENLFYRPENYAYFLRRYESYLAPFVDTLAYALMPNHFHLLIRVKEEEEQSPRLGKSDRKSDAKSDVSNQLRLFFMAYSKAINKQEGREGSLFRKYFRRKLITDQRYLLTAIYYIHRNPIHHGFTDILTDYPWTSYGAVLSDEPSVIHKEAVFSAFGGRTAFIDFHHRPPADNEEYPFEE